MSCDLEERQRQESSQAGIRPCPLLLLYAQHSGLSSPLNKVRPIKPCGNEKKHRGVVLMVPVVDKEIVRVVAGSKRECV